MELIIAILKIFFSSKLYFNFAMFIAFISFFLIIACLIKKRFIDAIAILAIVCILLFVVPVIFWLGCLLVTAILMIECLWTTKF